MARINGVKIWLVQGPDGEPRLRGDPVVPPARGEVRRRLARTGTNEVPPTLRRRQADLSEPTHLPEFSGERRWSLGLSGDAARCLGVKAMTQRLEWVTV
jgi:hypothetical protein